MDSKQFGRLILAMGRGIGRRGVLGLLGGVVAVGLGEATAKNRHRRKVKNRRRDRKQTDLKEERRGKRPPPSPTCKAPSYKIDSGQFSPDTCGTISHSGSECTCTIEWCVSPDGKSLSFGPGLNGGTGTPCYVGSVVIKAGKGTQTTPVNDTSGTVKVPSNGPNNTTPDISNFTFCGVTCLCPSGVPPCNGVCCETFPNTTPTCTSDGKCDWICTAESPGVCCVPSHPTFVQNFENDTLGWYGVDRDPDAKTAEVNSSSFTYWGGKTMEFPPNGYITEVDIYLDPDNTAPGEWFDYTSAIGRPDTCNHRRDFVFSVGRKSTSPGPFCVSAGNNSPGDTCRSLDPYDDNHQPITITAAGWYTFQHRFYDADGQGDLAVEMILIGPDDQVVKKWTRNCVVGPDDDTGCNNAGETDANDEIGVTVGGHLYGWFPVQMIPGLTIDNTRRESL